MSTALELRRACVGEQAEPRIMFGKRPPPPHFPFAGLASLLASLQLPRFNRLPDLRTRALRQILERRLAEVHVQSTRAVSGFGDSHYLRAKRQALGSRLLEIDRKQNRQFHSLADVGIGMSVPGEA